MQIVQRVGHERRIYFYTQAVDSFHDFRRRIAFFRHAARFEDQWPLPRRERPAVDEYFSAFPTLLSMFEILYFFRRTRTETFAGGVPYNKHTSQNLSINAKLRANTIK